MVELKSNEFMTESGLFLQTTDGEFAIETDNQRLVIQHATGNLYDNHFSRLYIRYERCNRSVSIFLCDLNSVETK